VVFHRRRGPNAWRGFRDVRRELRTRDFDLLLGLQVYFKSGLITAMARARVKLGFDLRRARDAQWVFTNERIAAHPPQHVQDQYFEFLTHLGIDPEPVTWGLALADAERASQTAFFAGLGGPACAVVVGTSRREKNWEPERWARLLEHIESKHGLRPILVGGASSEERRIADAILAETRAHAVDALANDLRRLVWLLDGSALIVTPDTGPLHIARALGTPVVGLFGHTNPKRSGPYRAFGDLVVDGYAAYEGEDYPVAGPLRDVMRRVTVDAVLKKVDLAMAKYVGR
jgi:heptosyltransferase I